jgi:AcrR family transcriptional regulator
MPRNKREITPEAKRAEICAVALERFMAHGYEGTSVGSIAAELGVAQNTIYWYFKTKDDILAGALEHMTRGLYARLMASEHQPLLERVSRLLEDASSHHCLFAILQWRLPLSKSLEVWHAAWHAQMQAVFVQRLCTKGVALPQAELTTAVGMFVAEGIVCHRMPEALRRQSIDWLCLALEGEQVLSVPQASSALEAHA